MPSPGPGFRKTGNVILFSVYLYCRFAQILPVLLVFVNFHSMYSGEVSEEMDISSHVSVFWGPGVFKVLETKML